MNALKKEYFQKVVELLERLGCQQLQVDGELAPAWLGAGCWADSGNQNSKEE